MSESWAVNQMCSFYDFLTSGEGTIVRYGKPDSAPRYTSGWHRHLLSGLTGSGNIPETSPFPTHERQTTLNPGTT